MSDTSPTDQVTEALETERDRLRTVAYRTLGSYADAEDVVQEACLRLSRQDVETTHNLARRTAPTARRPHRGAGAAHRMARPLVMTYLLALPDFTLHGDGG